jgi:geranylgeranylglycerol-phosphate geranylgeranyltransferase
MNMNRFLATIEIVRPHNMIAAATCVSAGYYIAGGRQLAVMIYPALLTALVVGFGNLINDYFDADIDRVNKPRRPIPSGRLSSAYVRSLYCIGTAAITVAAFVTIDMVLAIIILVWQLSLFLYAWKFKRLPVVGHLLVGLVTSSAFLFGAVAVNNIDAVAFPVFFAFIFMMGRELVKGAEDVEGDRIVGARTLSVRLGARRTSNLAVCFMLACVIAAPMPVFFRHYGFLYMIVMGLTVMPGLLLAAYLVFRYPGRAVLHRVSWILKIEMFFGIAAMAMGKL